MLDLIIISNYWHFPNEKSNSRYAAVSELAVKAGFCTEVVTSRFYHTAKSHRNIGDISTPYKVTLLDEPPYKKNVSPQRVIAHRRFCKNVMAYLKRRKKPDVIYLFVPPTGLAKQVVKFANKNGIRVVIDVLDLWPEAFGMFLPPVLAKPLLYPMKRSVEYAYRNADEIVAVSNSYALRASSLNRKGAKGYGVFIGADKAVFDAAAKNAPPLTNRLRPITMVYIGMLGHSYDLCGVMDAMQMLIKSGFDEVELLVVGDGPLKPRFEAYAAQKNLPVRFTGRLSYEDTVKTTVRCDIAVNVLVEKAAQSIINKQSDYVFAAIPIINVQANGEFGDLLAEYNAGFGCKPGDTAALAKIIRTLAQDETMRCTMGKNSRRLAEERFNRSSTYGTIIDAIKGDVK